jgi:hypothetical protein
VQVYLWGLAAVGMQQYRIANAKAMGGGSDDYKLGYLGDLLKSKIEHVTGNPDSMYIDYFTLGLLHARLSTLTNSLKGTDTFT